MWSERAGGALQRTVEVSLLLLEEAVAPGDYLILQARAWAVEKITAAQAREAYRLFDELFAANAPNGWLRHLAGRLIR